MSENPNETVVTGNEEENVNYIEAINNLKATTVSRDKYDKVVEENKKLLDSLINGSEAPTGEEDIIKPPSDDDCRAVIFNENTNNLEYCKAALQLRDNILQSTGEDIFVAKGHQVTPTSESYESAQRTAQAIRDAIDYCNGDSDLFTQELMRNTQDVIVPRFNNKK